MVFSEPQRNCVQSMSKLWFGTCAQRSGVLHRGTIPPTPNHLPGPSYLGRQLEETLHCLGISRAHRQDGPGTVFKPRFWAPFRRRSCDGERQYRAGGVTLAEKVREA